MSPTPTFRLFEHLEELTIAVALEVRRVPDVAANMSFRAERVPGFDGIVLIGHADDRPPLRLKVAMGPDPEVVAEETFDKVYDWAVWGEVTPRDVAFLPPGVE